MTSAVFALVLAPAALAWIAGVAVLLCQGGQARQSWATLGYATGLVAWAIFPFVLALLIGATP